MTRIRPLTAPDLDRVPEIDRAERVAEIYRVQGGALALERVEWDIPGWDQDELRRDLAWCTLCLGRGGSAWGAFDGDRLVGVAVLDGRPLAGAPDTLDLFFLYVDRAYRDQGLGRRLLERAAQEARALGASRLYVSSSPSRHTVEFYQGCGFRLAEEPDPELLAREPEDIHLVRPL